MMYNEGSRTFISNRKPQKLPQRIVNPLIRLARISHNIPQLYIPVSINQLT